MQQDENECAFPTVEEYGEEDEDEDEEEYEEEEDEANVLEILNALASRSMLLLQRQEREQDQEQERGDSHNNQQQHLFDYFWETITNHVVPTHTNIQPSNHTYDNGCLLYWEKCQQLASLLPRLDPFQIHCLASQALILSPPPLQQQHHHHHQQQQQQQDAHTTTTSSSSNNNMHYFAPFCLLLCAWSLTQSCPSKLMLRWKRWHSMLCETIRLFQRFRKPDWEVHLWIHVLLPTVQQTVVMLKVHTPYTNTIKDMTWQMGIQAGIVGTMLELMAHHPKQTMQCLLALEETNIALSSSEILQHLWNLDLFYNTNTEAVAAAEKDKEDDEDDEDDESDDTMTTTSTAKARHSAQLNKSNLVWWTECANCHDSVSGMDTSWNTRGLAYMAWECWKKDDTKDDWKDCTKSCKSSLSLPMHVWDTYFPYVVSLLEYQHDDDDDADDDDDDHYNNNNKIGWSLLESLVASLPHRTINRWQQQLSTNPIATLQILINQLVQKSCLTFSQQQRQQQCHSQQNDAVDFPKLLQNLLDMYTPHIQVELVQELMQQCPYLGIKPKLLDLLRPLARDYCHPETCFELWKWIHDSYWQDMMTMPVLLTDCEGHDQFLLNETSETVLSFLVDKVELWVSSTSLVQLYLMMHHSWPFHGLAVEGNMEQELKVLIIALRKKWMEWTIQNEKPEEYHRLFLLLSTLERVEEELHRVHQDV